MPCALIKFIIVVVVVVAGNVLWVLKHNYLICPYSATEYMKNVWWVSSYHGVVCSPPEMNFTLHKDSMPLCLLCIAMQ